VIIFNDEVEDISYVFTDLSGSLEFREMDAICLQGILFRKAAMTALNKG